MRIQIMKVPSNTITVEKKEIILQPTPSGNYAQKVNTGTHDSGKDQQIQVSEGSFIFSDTKALKIKDEAIHKEYGKPYKKGGYTPAALGAQYVSSLNKFTEKLNNPDTDKASRETAQMMVNNYMGKLGKLAQYQESMKEAMGIPTSPKMAAGGKAGKKSQVPMTQVFDENGRMSFVPDTGYMNTPDTPVSNQQPVNNNWYWGQRDGIYGPVNRPQEQIAPLDVAPMIVLPTNIQANNNTPAVDTTLGNSQSDTPAETPEEKLTTQQIPRSKMFTMPDNLALANSMLNYSGLHKYLPYETPVTGVIPKTVYTDPTRALAANSEQAAMAYRSAAGNRGNNLANFLAIQGQAGKQSADILSQYSNVNQQIANQGNVQAAQITNQILEAQRNRLKSLHQGNVIAAQQYDNAEREARADLLNVYNNAWKNRQMLDDINQTSQYYYRDPVTGIMNFNSDAGKAAMLKVAQGAGPSSASDKTYNDWYNYYSTTMGLPEDDAREAAIDAVRKQSALPRTRTTYDNKGNKKSTSVSQRYGGLQRFLK